MSVRENYTFNPTGASTVPIKRIDDKRQITATFTVSQANFFPYKLFTVEKQSCVYQSLSFPQILT